MGVVRPYLILNASRSLLGSIAQARLTRILSLIEAYSLNSERYENMA